MTDTSTMAWWRVAGACTALALAVGTTAAQPARRKAGPPSPPPPPVRSPAEQRLDSLAGAWREGRYADVIVPLLLLQADLADSSRFRAEYMVATSLCRSARADERRQGVVFFDAVQRRLAGRLADATRDAVRGEREACARSAPVAAPVEPRWQLASAGRIGQSTYNGGKWGINRCAGDLMIYPAPLDSGTVRRSFPAPLIAAPGQATMVLAAVRRRLAAAGFAGYRADTAGGMVLVAPPGRWAAVRRDAVGPLAAHRRYLANALTLQPVDSLLTLYVVRDADFQRFAVRMHGLRVPGELVGYSMREDLSMVVRPVGRWWGTAMHEQTHLVRALRLPDAPAWFDEGLAALFEVAEVQGDSVRGLPNWRGGVLAMGEWRDPTIAVLDDVLGRSYVAMHAGASQRIADTHGYARYLLLHVQRQGALADLVTTIRDRRTATIDRTTGALTITDGDPLADRALVARVLGTTPSGLDSAFRTFLSAVIPPRPVVPGSECRYSSG
jgi:hypothetical protein